MAKAMRRKTNTKGLDKKAMGKALPLWVGAGVEWLGTNPNTEIVGVY